jgi:spermidine synthase
MRAGVLIASTLLFLPPLTFLGFIAPYALRLAIQELEHTGRTAGLLYAISTVGSVVGAIASGFYLVPTLGVTMTLLAIACVLALPCALWAVIARRPGHAVAVVVLTAAMGSLGVWRAEARPYAETDQVRLLSERDGRYALVSIAEVPELFGQPDGDWVRWLIIDGIPQTGVIPARDFENHTPLHRVQSDFYELHGRQPETALIIGLGGGAVPMTLVKQGVAVEVVDIDPLVVEMAVEWMGFDQERVPVHIMDGRAHIRRCEKTYDLVVFDVATGGAQPFHLFTREIFEETARVLAPGGVLAINYIGFPEGERDFLARAVFSTVTEVFPHSATYIYPERGRRTQRDLCNIMFFFSDEPFRDDQAIHDDPETTTAQRRTLEKDFLTLRGEIEPSGVILTDDRNPIERHSVAVNEVWRRQVFRITPTRLLHRL